MSHLYFSSSIIRQDGVLRYFIVSSIFPAVKHLGGKTSPWRYALNVCRVTGKRTPAYIHSLGWARHFSLLCSFSDWSGTRCLLAGAR